MTRRNPIPVVPLWYGAGPLWSPVWGRPVRLNPPRPPEDVVRVAQEALRRELGRKVPGFEPYPTLVIPEGVIYFASGSDAGEAMGMVEIGIPPGFSAADCAGKRAEPTDCEIGIMQLGGMGFPVFLDSGAVSEARSGRKVPDKEWARRFAFYERVARAHPHMTYLVAPDKLGDQKESLRRLRKFAPLFRKLQRAPYWARVLVPLQPGRKSPEAYFREAKKILGSRVTPAIPWRKGAGWDLDMLEGFLASERPGSIHMLGLGPGGRSAAKVSALTRSYVPAGEISWDARLAQRGVGVASGLQPYSYAQRIAQAVLEDAALQARGDISFWTRGAGWWFPDETESVVDLDLWLSRPYAEGLAQILCLSPRETRALIQDPIGWIYSSEPYEVRNRLYVRQAEDWRDEPEHGPCTAPLPLGTRQPPAPKFSTYLQEVPLGGRIELPWVEEGIRQQWVRFLEAGRAAMKKRLAIKLAFEQRGEIDPDVQAAAREFAELMIYDWQPRMLFG